MSGSSHRSSSAPRTTTWAWSATLSPSTRKKSNMIRHLNSVQFTAKTVIFTATTCKRNVITRVGSSKTSPLSKTKDPSRSRWRWRESRSLPACSTRSSEKQSKTNASSANIRPSSGWSWRTKMEFPWSPFQKKRRSSSRKLHSPTRSKNSNSQRGRCRRLSIMERRAWIWALSPRCKSRCPCSTIPATISKSGWTWSRPCTLKKTKCRVRNSLWSRICQHQPIKRSSTTKLLMSGDWCRVSMKLLVTLA